MANFKVDTIGYWLNHLPNDIKKKAFANTRLEAGTNKEYKAALKWGVSSLDLALLDAFTWRNSPEKFKYWNDICINISKQAKK